VQEVKQAAQGKFDVVLDALGKPETEQLGIELLKKGGQYVTLHGETARLTDELGIVAGGAAAVAQLARKRLQYQYTHGVGKWGDIWVFSFGTCFWL
jgi:NADPH:quinone reductase-like Zn-dependent oxidoreductase